MPTNYYRDFTPGSGEQQNFQSGTWYASALADKIAHADLDPNSSDITIQINSDISWINNGTISWHFNPSTSPGNNKLDFLTVALKTICTGLGFISSARVSGGSGYWGAMGYPYIYDQFVQDGNPSPNQMILFNSPSSFLKDFYESNDIFFSGPHALAANGGNILPRLHAPSQFENGISINFFGKLFNNPKLMDATISFGAQIHSPTPVDLAVLEDIGWDLDLGVGIEDDLLLDLGQTILGEGGTFSFSSTFYDSEPYGDYIVSSDWTIELFHQNGIYVYESGTVAYSTNWSGTVNYLPIGNTWLRNDDGSVRGRVKIVGTDSEGIIHEDYRAIGVAYPPDAPVITLHPQSGKQATISFYSQGVNTYKVYYDTNPGVPYVGSGLPQGSSPLSLNYEVNYQTFTNLASGETYYLNVVAENDYGISDYGNEVMFTVNCTVPSNAFDLPDCKPQGQSIWLDATGTNNDANSGDIFYLIIYNQNTGTYSGYHGSGSIGAFGLLNIEQEMIRYSGPVPTFGQGTYTITLYYYICGNFQFEQESINIIHPLANCSPGNGGGNGSAKLSSSGSKNFMIELFPNPSNGKVSFNYLLEVPNAEVQVFDLNGKLLKTHIISDHEGLVKLDLTHLSSGMYLVKFVSEAKLISTEKLILTR